MRRLILTLTTLCALIISSYVVLFYTATGSKFILKWLPQFLPIELEYAEFSGNLHDGLQLTQLKIPLPDNSITLQTITLKTALNFSYNPLTWKVTIDTGQQQLSPYFSSVEGDIAAKILGEGRVSLALRNSAVITIKELTGKVYDQEITGHGTLQLSQDETLDIKHLQLRTGENYIDLDGRLTDKWQLNWDIHLPKVSQINHQITGKIIGKGKIQGPKLKPSVNGDLNISNLATSDISIEQLQVKSNVNETKITLEVVGQQIKYNETLLQKLTAEAELTGKQQMITAKCQLPEAAFEFSLRGKLQKNIWQGIVDLTSLKPTKLSSQLNINAKLSKQHSLLNWQTYPLAIKITAGLESLAFLDPMITAVNDLNGKLVTEWLLSGTPKQPKLTGKAVITHGQLAFPAAGAKLSDITLTVHSTDTTHLRYEGHANAGNGKLNVSGETHFLPERLDTKFHLTGTNAEVVNLHTAKVNINPDLDVTIVGNKVNVTGDVTVLDSLLTPEDYSSTVTLSDDVVFVSDQNKPKPSPWQLTSKIRLRLGDKVLLSFMGLRAILGGEVVLSDSTAQATTASGQLFVKRGRFDIYGQSLKIQEGQLLFTGGPVTNPGLNVRAIKNVGAISSSGSNFSDQQKYLSNDTTVGVKVVGTINKPKLSLFSTPRGLSQAQILSQLVLGKPLSEVADEKDQLLEALKKTETKPTESKMLVDQLKHSLGLDELSVQTGDAENGKAQSAIKNTSLTLGKLLSPKLLLSYSVGLSESANIFNLTYRLNKKWMIRSQTDLDSSSVDLIYSIETD